MYPFSCRDYELLFVLIFEVIYITVVSICRGLAFGGDTFFSQVIVFLKKTFFHTLKKHRA